MRASCSVKETALFVRVWFWVREKNESYVKTSIDIFAQEFILSSKNSL